MGRDYRSGGGASTGGDNNKMRLIALAVAIAVLAVGAAYSKVAEGEKSAVKITQKKQKSPKIKSKTGGKMSGKVAKTEEEWRHCLTPEGFRIMRQKGTEAPFTGKYVNTKTVGVYKCAGCGHELFDSDTKFDSGTGWPSFFKPKEKTAVDEHVDDGHGMVRTEITCSKCGAHLGHVFPDGPKPTGLRYCINSESLKLEEQPVKPEKSQ